MWHRTLKRHLGIHLGNLRDKLRRIDLQEGPGTQTSMPRHIWLSILLQRFHLLPNVQESDPKGKTSTS